MPGATPQPNPSLKHARASAILGANNSGWRAYLFALVLSDLVMIYLAFRAAYWIRFSANLPFFEPGGLSDAPFYDATMLAIIPLWLLIFALIGLYNRANLLGGIQEYALLVNAVTYGMLLIVIARFTLPDDLILARGWALLAWLLAILFCGIARFLMRRLVYRLRARGLFQTNAVMIGYNQEAQLMADQFHQNPASSMRMVGYLARQAKADSAPGFPHLGAISDLDQIVKSLDVRRLLLVTSALTREEILDLYQRYGNSKTLELLLSSGLYEMITTGMQVQVDGYVPMMKVNRLRMTGLDLAMKTVMDYLLAAILVILTSPVMLIIALWVKSDSPGPVIYRRRVMGVNGHEFDAFKFRSMDTRSEEILRSDPKLLEEYKRSFKITNDPRVTRSGKLLRKLSLDELPQLFNVLRGEMSLVGPRMITPEELEKYSQWAHNLLTVKPGITGFWQVHGRSDVSYEERVRMDMYYIRNWTIWLDIQVLIDTIPAVVAKRGAY